MRRHLICFLLCGICLAAPTDKGTLSKQEIGSEVEQLDQLRQENEHRNFEVVRTEESHIVDVNGHREEKTDKENVVLANGKVVASAKQTINTDQDSPEKNPHSVAKTEVNVPQLGIHRSSISDNLDTGKNEQEKKSPANWYTPSEERSQEYYNKYSGVQYTPTDLAEYIVRTGDEEGVALAIEELLREGMIGREEAIQYLQEVKNSLDFMRNRYERSRRIEDDSIPANIRIQQAANTKVPNQTNELKQQAKLENAETVTDAPTSNAPQQTVPKSQEKEVSTSPVIERRNKPYNFRQVPKQEEVDVSDVLEKLKTANTMREEVTLEEIIYQLSKDMFAQSLIRGDPTAEESLTKIASFLESEVMNNRISRDMEQKILDIVSAALMETLREFPTFLQSNQVPLYEQERNAIYRQQLAANHNIERRDNSDPDVSAKIANSARQAMSLTSNKPAVVDTGDEPSNQNILQKQPKTQQKA